MRYNNISCCREDWSLAMKWLKINECSKHSLCTVYPISFTQFMIKRQLSDFPWNLFVFPDWNLKASLSSYTTRAWDPGCGLWVESSIPHLRNFNDSNTTHQHHNFRGKVINTTKPEPQNYQFETQILVHVTHDGFKVYNWTFNPHFYTW